jgi:hypothetical protein
VDERRDGSRPERRLLFAVFFLLYALTSPGHVQGDTEIRWAVATRLVETGWFDLAPGTTHLYVEGDDGRRYSFFGLGQSLSFVPFVIAGKALAHLPLGGGAGVLGPFLASILFFPLCGALAVAVLHALVRDCSRDARAASLVAILFGSATMHWHHSVNTYEASQVSLLLLTCLWAGRRAWHGSGWGAPLLAMGAAGLALLFRLPSVIMTAPLLLTIVIADLRGRRDGAAVQARLAQWIGAGLAGVLPFVALVAVYNTLRFGAPLETGYDALVGVWSFDEAGNRLLKVESLPLFGTPWHEGFLGMLFSPGKSVFLYNPLLCATVPGIALLWRRWRAMALAVGLVVGTNVAFHSKYLYWSGDVAWGPRYLADTLGIWCLALFPLLLPPARRWLRRTLLWLGLVSALVQVASVAYPFGTEFVQQPSHRTIPDAWVWRPAESHLWWRARTLLLDVAGAPVPGYGPGERFPLEHPHAVTASHAPLLAIFPVQARAAQPGPRLIAALWTMWCAGAAALVLALTLWWRRARAPARAPARGPDPGVPPRSLEG